MIDPHELKNKQFSKAIKGYSMAEVDEHIDFIIEKYTELYRRNDELERQLQTAESQIENYKKDEESIRSALVNAQRASSKIIDEANDRADALLRSSKSNCDRVLAEFRQNIEREKRSLAAVTEAIRAFKAQLFEAYSSHIEYIEQISPAPETDPFDIPDEVFTREVLGGVKNDLSTGKYSRSSAEQTDESNTPSAADAPKSISGAAPAPQINAAPEEAPTPESSPAPQLREEREIPRAAAIPQNMPAPDIIDEPDELDADDARLVGSGDDIPAPPDAKIMTAADKNEDTVEFTDEEFAAARDMFRTMGKKSKLEIVSNDEPEEAPQDIDAAYRNDNAQPDTLNHARRDAIEPSDSSVDAPKQNQAHGMSVKDTILSLNKKFEEDGSNGSDEQNDAEYGDFVSTVAPSGEKHGKIVKNQKKLTPEEEFDAVYNTKKK